MPRASAWHAGPSPDAVRRSLAIAGGVLVVAAALLAALVDDPRLLRVAVLLAIAAAASIPAALRGLGGSDARRLAAEVTQLRAAVDTLAQRPVAVAAPPTVYAVASSYAAAASSTSAPIGSPVHRVVDVGAGTELVGLDAGAGANAAGANGTDRPALRLPLVQAALRASYEGEPASAQAGQPTLTPLVLDLVALEDEIDLRTRERR
jgi:hypothetical protein